MGAPATIRHPARGRLLRVLGVGFGLAVTVGNTIGAGILRTPGEVASHLPNPLLFFAIWLAGGMFVLLCAESVAEVATLLPRSGGHYVFAHYAFGDYAGFIVGWNDWLSTCGAVAAVAIIIGEYAGMLLPALAGRATGIAIIVVVAIAMSQWRGVRWGSGIQQITTLLKALGFLFLIAACFVVGGAAPASAAPLPQANLWIAMVVSLQAVIYTYDGWAGVIYFSEEVRDPRRDIARSMFGGIAAVIAIYMLLNVGVLRVLPMAQVAGNDLPIGTAVRMIWGNYADKLLEGVVIVSMLSAINAFELMACRIVFAMSRDGLFFRFANRVNKGGTPATTLWLSAAVAVLFIVTGTFTQVIAVLAFFFVFNYVLSLASVVQLRRREPERPRPYRAWGYPWTTALALCFSVTFLAGTIASDRRDAVYSVLLLAASYPAFRWQQAWRRTQTAASSLRSE